MAKGFTLLTNNECTILSLYCKIHHRDSYLFNCLTWGKVHRIFASSLVMSSLSLHTCLLSVFTCEMFELNEKNARSLSEAHSGLRESQKRARAQCCAQDGQNESAGWQGPEEIGSSWKDIVFDTNLTSRICSSEQVALRARWAGAKNQSAPKEEGNLGGISHRKFYLNKMPLKVSLGCIIGLLVCIIDSLWCVCFFLDPKPSRTKQKHSEDRHALYQGKTECMLRKMIRI